MAATSSCSNALAPSPPSAGVAALLLDLPSRGYFSSSSIPPVALAAARVYICDHDTAPPDEQTIKTDTTNILIRSLTSKKAKSDSKAKDKAKAAIDGGRVKRPAEKVADEKIVLKRANTGTGSSSSSSKNEGSSGSLSEKEIQGCTVEKLRSLLKKRNLPRTGKKEELIARLKQAEQLR